MAEKGGRREEFYFYLELVFVMDLNISNLDLIVKVLRNIMIWISCWECFQVGKGPSTQVTPWFLFVK